MKKFLTIILALLFVICSACLFACGGDDTGSANNSQQQEQENENNNSNNDNENNNNDTGKQEHTHNYISVVIEPTCTEKGYTKHTCSCGNSYKDNYNDKLGHSWGEYVYDGNATYDNDGTKTATCTRDGCSATDTKTDLGTRLDSTIQFKTLTVNYNSVSGKLSNATASFSFENEIEIKGNATYIISKNANGSPTISNTVSLNEGDNVFYIIVDKGNNGYATYTVTLRRTPKYTVSFNTNGGGSVTSQKIIEGELANKPNDLTKTGYAFNGWDFDFTTPITGNKTVNAKWTANTYELSFDGNGVDNPEKTTVTYDSTYSGKLPELTRNGYTFKGWTTEKDGSTYVNDYTYVKTADKHTLYAKWQAKSYKISFSSGTGYTLTATKNGNNFTSGSYITIEDKLVFTVTAKDGYTAGAITVSGTNRTFSNNELSGVYENITVSSSATANTYELTLDGNGVDNPEKTTVTYDSTYSGKLPELTRNGYTFKGWTTEKDGTTYVNDYTYVKTADKHTLYAKWQANSYKVSFSSGTGYTLTATKNGNNFTSGSYITIEDKLVFTVTAKDGYTAGAITASGTNRTFTNNELSGVYENITVSSSATANTYELSFDGNGVDNPEKTTVTYNSQYGTLPSLERNGYTFKGWTTEKDGTTYVNDYTYVKTADKHTLYAKWQAKSYKLTVDKSHSAATLSTNGNKYYYCDSQITLTVEEIYLGYEFIGWYNDTEELSKDLTYTFNMPPNALTVTAKFKAIAEMEIFEFESWVSDSVCYCAITGIKDKTLTEITVPSFVKYIYRSAFNGCSSLESITLPFIGESRTSSGIYGLFGYIFGDDIYDGGTLIGQSYEPGYFVDYCIPNSLKNVNIIGGNIDYGAFSGCSFITNITIGEDVESINSHAFSGCDSLTGITVDAKNSNYVSQDGVLYNKDKTTIICCPVVKSGVFSIPNSVTSIDNFAFYRCASLTSIEVPSGVTSIGEYAFYKCTSLTSIDIPSRLTSIGEYAFNNCSSLESNIVIPDSVIDIGEYAFEYSGIKSITIGNGVKNIKDWTFNCCENLENITLGNSVESIGYCAFQSCAFKSITIGDSVTHIGDAAFFQTKLENVTIGKNVKTIGERAFKCYSILTSVTFEDTSGWHYTSASNHNYTGGTPITLGSASENATMLKTTYMDKYWYKTEE